MLNRTSNRTSTAHQTAHQPHINCTSIVLLTPPNAKAPTAHNNYNHKGKCNQIEKHCKDANVKQAKRDPCFTLALPPFQPLATGMQVNCGRNCKNAGEMWWARMQPHIPAHAPHIARTYPRTSNRTTTTTHKRSRSPPETRAKELPEP